MANMKPTVCGDNNLYVPDSGCSDCDELELRVRRLEECCADAQSALAQLQDALNGKQDKLVAGNNITITGNVISATSDLTCETLGNCSVIQNMQSEINRKLEISNILAGENITIEEDGNGNILISSEGGGGCECTKQEIMSCLGVRELPMTITDTDGSSEDWYILGRLRSEPATGGAIESCSCTKEQLLSILGYQEVIYTLTDDDNITREWVLIGRPRT